VRLRPDATVYYFYCEARKGMTGVRFTGATLDRASELRNDRSEMERLLADPRARFVGASAGHVVVSAHEADGGMHLLRRPLDGQVNPYQPILLGLEEGGRPLFAADVSEPEAGALLEATGAGRLLALRDAGLLLSQTEGGLAAYLVALLNWHRTHMFCSMCGSGTKVAEAGLSRRCPRCKVSHFPRTDPVVIMLVSDGERLLLGRRIGWEPGRFSILAGFVSSGETPEEAVVREVLEESGIVAHSPRYIASQPWPFPSSLMLGFEAGADGGEPVAHVSEMADVRWFTLRQITAAQQRHGPLGDGTLTLPGEVSIARSLIDGWVARGGRRLQ
jgi:NAD+ diphosphatase